MSDIMKATEIVHELSEQVRVTELIVVTPFFWNCEYGYDEFEEPIGVFDSVELAQAFIDSRDKNLEMEYQMTKLPLNRK